MPIDTSRRPAVAPQVTGCSDWFTREEAAALLHRNPRTLEQWAYKGVGPRYSRVGKRGRAIYRREDLDAFVAAHLVETDIGGDAA